MWNYIAQESGFLSLKKSENNVKDFKVSKSLLVPFSVEN